MNIVKALKKKNQLVGEINKLAIIVSRENVKLNENDSRFDVKSAYAEYKAKLAELVALKTSIAVANTGIWGKIFEIVERKNRIAFLRNVPTREGTFKERSYAEAVENIYTPTINAKAVEDEIKQLEQEIVDLQDEVDNYNYTTSI